MNLVTPLKQAGIAASIFLLMSLPQVYGKSNDFIKEQGDCPTFKTRLMHFVAYFVLLVLALKYVAKIDKPLAEICGYALYAALLFFFISSPEMYQITNSLAGNYMRIADGACPTFNGVLAHTAVFAVCMAAWQTYFPKENVYIEAEKA